MRPPRVPIALDDNTTLRTNTQATNYTCKYLFIISEPVNMVKIINLELNVLDLNTAKSKVNPEYMIKRAG